MYFLRLAAETYCNRRYPRNQINVPADLASGRADLAGWFFAPLLLLLLFSH